MQFPSQAKPAVGVIYDCELGANIDDLLALGLLYGLDGKNDCRVVSISLSNPSLKAAAASETVSRFYGGAASGAFNFAGRALPVGLAEKGSAIDSAIIEAPLKRLTPDGKPAYSHGIEKLTDTADPGAVIRNAFTAQHDGNAMAVLAGPATNLAETLRVGGAKGWIQQKCRYLSMMGGNFATGKPEYHIKKDIPAARQLLAEWPTPIIFAGEEVGAALPYPGSAIDTAFSWSPAHPLVDAYKAFKPMPYDAPASNMAAVLYAVRPQENYFKLSEPGTVTIGDDGSTKFTPSAEGKHRYIIVDPSKKDLILKTYVELTSAKPVIRLPRRRPNAADQQNAVDPAKPAPAVQPLVPPPAAP